MACQVNGRVPATCHRQEVRVDVVLMAIAINELDLAQSQTPVRCRHRATVEDG